MIGKLKGRIDSSDEDSLLLDVGGVCYQVYCAARTLAAMPAKGEAAELLIHTHVREDLLQLFGFPDATEREWFLTLMTVQGVGVRMAMAILSVFSPAQLAQAIAAKDTKSLTRVSGVGAKLAERLTTELKNKVAKLPTSALIINEKGKRTSALPPPSASEDALSALVNLGYSRSEAYTAVATAASKLGDVAIDSLIKESLRELAR